MIDKQLFLRNNSEHFGSISKSHRALFRVPLPLFSLAALQQATLWARNSDQRLQEQVDKDHRLQLKGVVFLQFFKFLLNLRTVT